MPTGFRMLPGGDLEKPGRSAEPEIRLEDFIVEPENVRPGSVYVKGSETPSQRAKVIGATVAAWVEQAWLDGDDDLVRQFLSRD